MKKLVIALMAFALVITLAGCGGGGGGPSDIEIYEGQAKSEDFYKNSTDTGYNSNYGAVKAGLEDMETVFASSAKSAADKKTTLGNYISANFYRGTDTAAKLKKELLNTMGDRFNRYTVNQWGFKVTSCTISDDGLEMETTCSIRFDLALKPGCSGNGAGDRAVLNRKIKWSNEGGTWRIVSGFPYDRNKDF